MHPVSLHSVPSSTQRLKPRQVVLEGADLTSPHTLGLVREGPCRRLAEIAMARYEALGLWRVCTLEAIQVASSLSLIARGEPSRRLTTIPSEASFVLGRTLSALRQLGCGAVSAVPVHPYFTVRPVPDRPGRLAVGALRPFHGCAQLGGYGRPTPVDAGRPRRLAGAGHVAPTAARP